MFIYTYFFNLHDKPNTMNEIYTWDYPPGQDRRQKEIDRLSKLRVLFRESDVVDFCDEHIVEVNIEEDGRYMCFIDRDENRMPYGIGRNPVIAMYEAMINYKAIELGI